MKVLVCGGRDFSNAALLTSVLNDLRHARGFTLLIHGGARGADTLAAQRAGLHQIPVRQFSADWATHDRAAGPIRNRQMLVEGRPQLVIAFPGGRGTVNMIQQAKAAAVETWIVLASSAKTARPVTNQSR